MRQEDMVMKVLMINGSPRSNGNTYTAPVSYTHLDIVDWLKDAGYAK